jgi:hypothetical protein
MTELSPRSMSRGTFFGFTPLLSLEDKHLLAADPLTVRDIVPELPHNQQGKNSTEQPHI